MVDYVFSLVIFLLIHLFEPSRGIVSDPEKEQLLINKLFKSYNRKLKPHGTVEIKFALNLNQIVNLIEKEQIIVLNVFLDHEWADNRLKWNPIEHDNITLLRINSELVWTPDTFVYTTADQTGFLLPQQGTYFLIQHNGVIFWPNPLTQMKLRCRMTIEWFPYDEQLCVIIFGSWSHTSRYLNYTLMTEEPSLLNFTENNEWSLIKYKPYRSETKYENWVENDSFAEINYKILIRRKPLFVVQNFVAPAVMLCILTLVSFFIPFAQEMQIGISILLSFAVFKLRLSDDVPVQADTIPLINIYFTMCLGFSLMSMVWFSIINFYREITPLPKYIRFIVLKFVCCFLSIKPDKLIKTKRTEFKSKKLNKKTDENTLNSSVSHLNGPLITTSSKLEFDSKKILTKYETSINPSNSFLRNIEIRISSESLSEHEHKEEEITYVEDLVSDQTILSILNKFVFYIFVLFIILLNAFALILFPYYFKTPLSIEDV